MAIEIEKLIPQKRLMEMLNISSQTIWRWCHVGLRGKKLAFVKIGRQLYFHPEAIEAFKRPSDTNQQEPAA